VCSANELLAAQIASTKNVDRGPLILPALEHAGKRDMSMNCQSPASWGQVPTVSPPSWGHPIQTWLEQDKPLKLVRVRELLARDGIDVSYTTLHRYARDEVRLAERTPTVRVDDPPPGEEVQVDFWQMGYVRTADGRRRKPWVLIVTLTMSRYKFVWPTFFQTLDALCEGLDAAWDFFGGVVARVATDNMTAAVTRADALDPGINPSFAEYAQAPACSSTQLGFYAHGTRRVSRIESPSFASAGLRASPSRTTWTLCAVQPPLGAAASPECGCSARRDRCLASCSSSTSCRT
jgi:hypothetical protein